MELPVITPAANELPTGMEIVATERRTDSWEVTLRRWHARSPLSADPFVQWSFALRHRSRGEALSGGEETSWPTGGRGNAAMSLLRLPRAMMGMGGGVSVHSAGQAFSAVTTLLQFPGRGFAKMPRLDPSWFDEVELVVLETLPDGVVTRGMTIEEFVVPER